VPARSLLWFALAGAACGAMLVSALAAANTVPASRAGASSGTITADSLKPLPACAGITLTVLVAGGSGGNAADLVLGTAGADTLRGNGRDDCIVGGGGNDSLRGDAGVDVCIGGPGTDTFHATCETQIQ
jgi:Ca2+-binding RTX toxin-like protein